MKHPFNPHSSPSPIKLYFKLNLQFTVPHISRALKEIFLYAHAKSIPFSLGLNNNSFLRIPTTHLQNCDFCQYLLPINFWLSSYFYISNKSQHFFLCPIQTTLTLLITLKSLTFSDYSTLHGIKSPCYFICFSFFKLFKGHPFFLNVFL